jgi:hypothetical protein
VNWKFGNAVESKSLRSVAQPKKYRSPSRKGGISPASRAPEGRAGLKQ